ncbi:hypothetical protein [Geobacter sp. AOG1]|uniref:hypothetical protein n=1 Tax=Geobacter sp. AOG1 TaxID=1566346 RepID=UPI001CC67F6A|nr:hypothetical protein [Geobacter sp. AOG1]GFE58626.1 hypothetical protein AOG1_25060 [Geobacter sp. AOG1]
MRVIRSLLLGALLSCSLPFAASAGETSPAHEWDAVLDRISASTWHGRAELNAELQQHEARIKQDLPGYITAWEQRLAVPIAYTDKKRTGDSCGPLTYCAADFLDIRKLVHLLRERNEPVARLLFDKLSPEAQQAITASAPPPLPPGQSGATSATAGATGAALEKAAQLLPGELTRIVREESLYTAERFTGVRLSFTTRSLVSEHNDAQNRVCINKSLLSETFPEEMAHNFKCVIQKDETYRRVVAARTVQYLRTGDTKTLATGIALSEKFEDKLMYTDFAFWYYYPRMLDDVQTGNEVALKYDAYALLNDAVLGGEPTAAAKSGPAELERRHYGWNLADVVLVRAIMEGRMSGLESLGSAIWLLGYRNEAPAGSGPERELALLLTDVRRYLTGPDSDNFRLNYAVAMREGMRRYALLIRALDTNEGGAAAEKLFNEARKYLRLAYEWAETGQGRATAVTNYLELINLAQARMKDMLPPTAYAALATSPGKANADTAVVLYHEMAARENEGWDQLRFVSRKSYIDSSQKLWNALRRNTVLVGDYYLQRMDKEDFQSVMDNAEPAERALLRYVKLFDEFTANGHREIMPDSAYFAAAECLKMLAQLKRIEYAYNNKIELHNQSITYLLKAIEVYPYDDSINVYAVMSKNINTPLVNRSLDNVLSRMVANPVTAKCLDSSRGFCDRSLTQTIEWNMYKAKNNLSGRTDIDRLEELKALVRNVQEGTPAPGPDTRAADAGQMAPQKANTAGRDTTSGNQRMYRLAERYLAVAEQQATLVAEARKQLVRSIAEGVGFATAPGADDRLLAKKDEAEKINAELLGSCTAYQQSPRNAGDGNGLADAAKLAALATDVSLYQTDQLIDLTMRKKLYELRLLDNHPMHKMLKASFYAN